MRKFAWIAFCVLVCSGLVFSQSITVTKPVANEVWYRGESYAITWTKSGSMPNQVRIALVNEAASSASDIVYNIALQTENDGSYSWFIPMVGFANGRYKIAIRAKGVNITGVSPGFRIAMKSSSLKPAPRTAPLEKMEPWVKITRPGPNKKWNFGDKEDILISTNFDSHYFRMDLTGAGGSRVFPIHEGAIEPYATENVARKYRYRWHIPVQSADNGYYRIRVKATSTEGEIEGLSEAVYLSEETSMTKIEKVLEPILIRDRHSRRFEDYNWQMIDDERDPQPNKEQEKRPGLMRVGFYNYYRESGASLTWAYTGFIFRSQIVFSFDEIKNKIRLPLKATLVLNRVDTFEVESGLHHGAGKIYVLTSPWSGKAIDTPGHFYKNIPQTSNPIIRIDILQQVKDWLSGSEENLGFLIGAAKEDFEHNDKKCWSFFKVSLEIEYYEEE